MKATRSKQPRTTTRTTTRMLGVAAGIAGLAFLSCSRSPAELTPPELYYGEDLCTACSMIISEERYAASIAYRDDTRVRYMLFDDIGELFDAELPENTEARYYVHDASSLEWLDATAAAYLWSKELHTPMGHGLAAFKTRVGAQAMAEEYPGEVLAYTELAARSRIPHPAAAPH